MWDITEKAYERNYNFIQRIIEVAKKELDEKSNWSFTYIPIKKGRSFELIEFTPVHFPERETKEVAKAEAIRQVNLSFFVAKEVKNYLTKTCEFSPREIKNNADTIKTFCTKFQGEAIDRMHEIWGRARGAKNPKGYLIGTLKSEIENY
jgi:plasmid replication initiation protein